jgi:phosphoglycerate kinase
MQTLRKAKLKGKTVLLRTDFNVPVKNGKVQDDTRIKAALPTIKFLLKNAKNVVIITHLGRPDGFDKNLVLDPIAQRLSDLLNRNVVKYDCIPDKTDAKLSMIENIRFYEGEKKNSSKLAKQLASLGDIYVNDAFSNSHRKHASMCAITKYLPAYPGFLLEKEIKELSKLRKPKRPFVIIIGGVKAKTKIQAIDNMKVDAILTGGAVAFTFMKSSGLEIGKSIFKPQEVKDCKKLLKKGKVMLPVDIVCGKKDGSKAKIYPYNNLPKSLAGFDIGPETCKVYSEIISEAKTVLWNGPMGLFEVKQYHKGTKCIANSISESKAFSAIGGGETITAINKFKISGFSFISTGGGAFLEFLEKGSLPAIAALKKNV